MSRRTPRSKLFPYTTLFRSEMARRMNIKDGYALQLAIKRGYRILVISGGNSEAVKNRLEKLRSEEHTSELQSQSNLVCRLLLEKKKIKSGCGQHLAQQDEIR